MRPLAALLTFVSAAAGIYASPGSVGELTFALPPVARPIDRPEPIDIPDPIDRPESRADFVDSGSKSSVHSSCLAELPDGSWVGYWFGGSREGAADVEIRGSRKAPGKDWSPERTVVKRLDLEKSLGRSIRKLGNPTVLTGPEGELYLFFVSASIGGWSGSAINLVRSRDGGDTWGEPVRLVSSPFLNISTLVRAPPLWLEDGRILLPTYHEFLAKFSELLVVTPSGRVEGKVRVRSSQGLIQPWVVPLDKNRAVAFMRSTDKSKPWIHRCVIGPSGTTTPEALRLPNPNAAVAALRLSPDRMMICFNPSDSNRHGLGLAVSDDEGISWGRVASAEEVDALPAGVDAAEFSYPWLSLGSDGQIRLSYTWHRVRIRFQEFEFER